MSEGRRELRRLPPEFELQPGFHGDASEGLCALEAVAWIAGLEHSDEPACVCPTLITLMRCLNDHMAHFQRQRLIPFLPRLVDTRGEGLSYLRAEELAWRALTQVAPVPLGARGFLEEAGGLTRLPRRDPERVKVTFESLLAQVNTAAWEEAQAKGARFWGQAVKVRPATWASVEVMKLGQQIVCALATRSPRADDLALPAARLIGAVGRFDDQAWWLALDGLEALLTLEPETEAEVVSLADYRPGSTRAA